MSEPAVASVTIDLADQDAMRLWRTVAAVATQLGDDDRWCLIGGLMVALFALESQQSARATTDIDILADARARPSGTSWVSHELESLGATLNHVDGLNAQRGFRFNLDGLLVDVLAPEGLRTRPTTTGRLHTIQVPGGTQALTRTEVVEILVDGRATRIRRPTLLAAILLKSRSLAIHSRPDDQRQDLITLLALVDDPRALRTQASGKELRWISAIEVSLDLDDPALERQSDPTQLRTARAAYRLLTR